MLSLSNALKAAVMTAAATAVTLTGAAPAGASTGQPVDPGLYCYNYQAGLATQIGQAGWQVSFTGVEGDPGQNNWRCDYVESISLPYGEGGEYTLVPFPYSTPVDWAAACSQQFPGSHLAWYADAQPGPIYQYGWSGEPWLCMP